MRLVRQIETRSGVARVQERVQADAFADGAHEGRIELVVDDLPGARVVRWQNGLVLAVQLLACPIS